MTDNEEITELEPAALKTGEEVRLRLSGQAYQDLVKLQAKYGVPSLRDLALLGLRILLRANGEPIYYRDPDTGAYIPFKYEL